MEPSAFLHPFARPAAGADEFTTIVRGEGATVVDAAGRRYLDATAALWFCQVGHGRAEIADAVARQLRTLDAFHCFDIFTNERAEELCARLAALAPMPGVRVFLTDSGSEAVDSALKLARLACAARGEPERTVVVGRNRSYHGVTYGGLSVMGLELNRVGWGPLVHEAHALGEDGLDAAAALFAERGAEIAAVIAEPVIGAGGVRPPEPGELEGLRRLCDEHGALLILDEVICGFGRLGGWWGATRYGVEPDLVTFAKGVTSGYQPLGGVLVGAAVREPLEASPDFLLRTGHTYSGHPATCAAALANLDVLVGDELLARADDVIAATLEPALRALVDDGLAIEARGLAGIWAVDVRPEVSAVDVRGALMARGVIARPIGTTTIALCPPLVITADELDEIVGALRHALGG